MEKKISQPVTDMEPPKAGSLASRKDNPTCGWCPRASSQWLKTRIDAPETTSLLSPSPFPTPPPSIPRRVFLKEHSLNKLWASRSVSQALLLEKLTWGTDFIHYMELEENQSFFDWLLWNIIIDYDLNYYQYFTDINQLVFCIKGTICPKKVIPKELLKFL